MRYSKLVLAAFFAVIASFVPDSAFAQKVERPAQKTPPPAVEINPVDEIVVDYLARVDRGVDPARTYVMGRATDFSGRSIRGAEVLLFSLDSDDIKRVTTNGFGYYRFSNLSEGESYLISIVHRKYLFVGVSTSFTLDSTPLQIDFQAEEMP